MLIGISGKKQCGKDTICKIIQAIDYYDRLDTSMPIETWVRENFEKSEISRHSTWKRRAFADKLKLMASVLVGFQTVLPWESGELKDSINEKFGITHREILQKLGQSLRDSISPDVWVKALFSEYENTPYVKNVCMGDKIGVISSVYTKFPDWIVPDVRMPNEAKAVIEHGGVLIRVNRDTKVIDTHISEIALDDYKDFDYVVDNNGTIEDLIKQIMPIYDRIRLTE